MQWRRLKETDHRSCCAGLAGVTLAQCVVAGEKGKGIGSRIGSMIFFSMPGIPFLKALPALLQVVPDNINKVCFSLEGCTARL